MAADQVVDGRRHALVGDVGDARAGGAVEHLAQDVHGRAAAGAAVGQAVALALGDQGLHVLDARGLVGGHEHGLHAGLHDGREAVQHVVAGARGRLEHELRNGEGIGRQQQGVAVRRGLGHMHAADGAAGAGAVVHEHGLAQARGQLLGIQARHGIGVATGRIGHDDGDGLGRIGLGHRGAGQRGCSQECSGKRNLATCLVHGEAVGWLGCGVSRQARSQCRLSVMNLPSDVPTPFWRRVLPSMPPSMAHSANTVGPGSNSRGCQSAVSWSSSA